MNKKPELSQGVKHDSKKRRFSLFPTKALYAVIDVLEYGARKYSEGNWRLVPDARTRYFDACMRHLLSWRSGEIYDRESSLPHLAHAATSLLFVLALEHREGDHDIQKHP